MLDAAAVTDLLALARQMQNSMLAQLESLVKLESPSHDKAAVDRCVQLSARWARELGGRCKIHRSSKWGDSLEVCFGVQRSGPRPFLLLGHLDTVWERGMLRQMPWRRLRDRVCGPGVLDMKAGVVMMFAAIALLKHAGLTPSPLIILLHGDEEVGSPGSRKLTEAVARRCRAVYVLEPAQGARGAYKTARKGVGQYRLQVNGVSAHSGVDFFEGHSAVEELARQLLAIKKLVNAKSGVTLNPGAIGGGTRSNVVAAEAWAEIDVRVARARDAARIDAALRRLRPQDPACTLHWSGGFNRLPMERTAATVKLFRQAQKFARAMHFDLQEAATGGGSDGNFTAALGVPTLDGMGACGLGAHAAHEHVLLRDLAERTALLAAMLV